MNKKRKDSRGFTLAEVLIVVAIVVVLASVAFVAVQSYMRSMAKLKYDGYARELFVAAQNHLSMADSQGYLGRTDLGTEEAPVAGLEDTGDGVYYYVVTGDHGAVDSGDTVLGLMLPRASVDETVRLGECYIIRYHPDSGLVLDVFCWSGSGGRYPHVYVNEYEDFLRKRTDRNALRTYGSDRSVIGYYGGAEARGLTRGAELQTPALAVRNAERLTVTVTDPNAAQANARLKLVITGLTSGVSRELELSPEAAAAAANVTRDASTGSYTVVLDDITARGLHFCELFCAAVGESMIPGEDVTLRAVAFNNAELTNVAGSAQQTVNSLFGDLSDPEAGSAEIGNIRHLENLSQAISRVNEGASPVQIRSALQTTDLSWPDFRSAIGSETLSVYAWGMSSSGSPAGTYMPVDPAGPLSYSGGGHSVSGVLVNDPGSAGLFGVMTGGGIRDLELKDFRITGKEAGALAGTLSGVTVSGVLARETGRSLEPAILGSDSAGGLVGSLTDGVLEKSGAALTVRSSGGSAGGLAGSLTGDCRAEACYSGGHTDAGEYYAHSGGARTAPIWNVTGAVCAGGLIGSAGSAQVTGCYSTCSATGALAGGLLGSGSGSTESCYAAGLVAGSEAEGALIGESAGSVSGCRYFALVNERVRPEGGYALLPALGGGAAQEGAVPLDDTADAYNAFLGSRDGWRAAGPYDPVLSLYWSGRYPLPDLTRTGGAAGTLAGTHYGDWPSPESRPMNAKD